MSDDESMERKDNRPWGNNETKPTAKSWFPNKLCSACGKESDTVKKCTACKCVWYCDKKCQNKHWREHKKECKVIKKELEKRGGKLDVGTELDIGPLGTLLPREECPICMRALPLHDGLHSYSACCGKVLCGGCELQNQIKNRKQADTCSFCRTRLPHSNEAILAQIRKKVERKDPPALNNLAMYYGHGMYGLPVDQHKCVDLLLESAGLGCPAAQYQLGNYYDHGEMGLERNEAEALKYWKKAAEGGDLDARHNLGGIEFRSDNHLAAMRHWRLAASGGFKKSMEALIFSFEECVLHHADLAESLRAFYLARAEMISDDRMQYIAHLKKTGEYEAEYDL